MLDRIREKVETGERLSAAEGGFLFRPETDLHAVGELAEIVNRRKNGNVAYYNRNAHLNPTNVCAYRCELCAYSRDKDDAQAYAMDIDEILKRGREASEAGCTELHIVSGAHPEKPYAWYLDMIRELHAAFPKLHLKAWTAVEIDWFTRLTGRPVLEILEEMQAAGLGSLPGGGAEIFDREIREQICPRKADGETWLMVHRTAHELGMRSNATMLYGHLENAKHRIDHLVQLRQLQDDTGGFQAFVPLAFHPENTRLSQHWQSQWHSAQGQSQWHAAGRQSQWHSDLRRASPLVDLRVVAVSRLMLDNFPHVKAYWISLGIGVAQTALAYGADDLDGTVRYERIHHAAGSKTPEALSIDELRGLIAETGREPVERDSLYRQVKRNGHDWQTNANE
jgi:aminodeoxyfutalosine synthase